MKMLEGVEVLDLRMLNEATQAWVELGADLSDRVS
jgi:ribosomal protein S16